MGPHPPGGHRRWFATWKGGALLAALSAAAAYVLQIEVGSRWPSWAHWVITGCGAILTFLGIWLAGRDARREKIARDEAEAIAKSARGSALIEMHGYLRPALNCLLQVTVATSAQAKREARVRMKQLVIDLAANLGENTRACFFESVSSQPRKLRCDGWRGMNQRQIEPRAEFKEDDHGAGEDRFAMLAKRASVLVEDVDKIPPPGWPGNRDYKTYIAATVFAGEKIFGFLGVDSTQPGDLTDDHRRTVENLAMLLAAALAVS